MLDNAKYVSNSGDTINFGTGGIYLSSVLPLRSYGWSYDTSHEQITGFYKDVDERNITIIINAETAKEAYSVRNKISNIFESDVRAETPGKLYIGSYYLECYIIGLDHKKRSNDNTALKVSATVLTESNEWIQETDYNFSATLITGGDLKQYDYLYQFYYDNAPEDEDEDETTDETITNPSNHESDFILTIYGAITNPIVEINGNEYQVNVQIEDGESVEINSSAKTIYLIGSDGERTNIFWSASKKDYIFTKIPAGKVPLAYSQEFSFDLVLLDSRSEPLWE